jgi:NAD(P)-dependent dehydrogenase (short-subunit alcohol dehydrogenase family)
VNLTVALRTRGLIQPALGSGEEEGRIVPTRVLFVGSGAAHKAIKGWPTYTISKAALYAAVRQLYSEGAPSSLPS